MYCKRYIVKVAWETELVYIWKALRPVPRACPFHPLCLSHILLTTIQLCMLTKGNTSFNKFFGGQPLRKCHTLFILFIGTSHHDFHGYLVIKLLPYILCVYFNTYPCVILMFTQSSTLFSFARPWVQVHPSVVAAVDFRQEVYKVCLESNETDFLGPSRRVEEQCLRAWRLVGDVKRSDPARLPLSLYRVWIACEVDSCLSVMSRVKMQHSVYQWDARKFCVKLEKSATETLWYRKPTVRMLYQKHKCSGGTKRSEKEERMWGWATHRAPINVSHFGQCGYGESGFGLWLTSEY